MIRELILASADSVVDVAARGDTVLHLAVKNNQFEAFKVLVEHLKKFNKEDVLNRKDDQGNTFLHLAVSKKQYEVYPVYLCYFSRFHFEKCYIEKIMKKLPCVYSVTFLFKILFLSIQFLFGFSSVTSNREKN